MRIGLKQVAGRYIQAASESQADAGDIDCGQNS